MAPIDLKCPAKFLKSTSTDVSSQRCRLRNTLVVEIEQIIIIIIIDMIMIMISIKNNFYDIDKS